MSKPPKSPSEGRKRRSAHEGTVRLRKDGYWEVRLRIDGQIKSAYAKTKDAALQKIHELIDARDKHRAVPPQRLTVKRFMDEWIATRTEQQRLAPRTLASYRQLVRDHIIPGIGHLKLARLGPRDLDAFYHRLLTRPAKPLAALTVKHVHEVLHKALHDATRQELIHRNPADLAEPPAAKAKQFPTFRSPAEATRFLLVAAKDDYFALWALALTGMREGELLGLTWDAVDFDRGTITVKRAMVRTTNGPLLDRPKTEQSNRTLVIHPRLLEIVQEHRDRQNALIEARQAAGKPVFAGVELGLVFLGRYGGILSTSFCVRRLRALLREAKLDARMRFHDLRHSSVTLLRAMGVTTTVASRRLGHSRESTTSDVYGKGDWDEMQEPAAEALDNLIPPSGDVH